jgi:hypothetical protein
LPAVQGLDGKRSIIEPIGAVASQQGRAAGDAAQSSLNYEPCHERERGKILDLQIVATARLIGRWPDPATRLVLGVEHCARGGIWVDARLDLSG